MSGTSQHTSCLALCCKPLLQVHVVMWCFTCSCFIKLPVTPKLRPIAVITVEPTFKWCYFQCARKRGFWVKRKYLNKESYVLLTCGLFSLFVFKSWSFIWPDSVVKSLVRHYITYGCVTRSNKPEYSNLSWHSLPIKTNNANLLRP